MNSGVDTSKDFTEMTLEELIQHADQLIEYNEARLDELEFSKGQQQRVQEDLLARAD